MNEGRIVSNDGLDIAIDEWEAAFEEDRHSPWSNALQAEHKGGRG